MKTEALKHIKKYGSIALFSVSIEKEDRFVVFKNKTKTDNPTLKIPFKDADQNWQTAHFDLKYKTGRLEAKRYLRNLLKNKEKENAAK